MPLGFRVYVHGERPAQSLVERVSRFRSPDLSDAMQRAGTMDGGIYSITRPAKRIVGCAVTVSVPNGAFQVIKAGMQQTRAGDVLVVNARGSLRGALVGGNVCRGMLHRGLAGIIADGAVRDADEISEDGLPVYARGLSAMMGPVEGPGEVNVSIACGNVVVHPGDIIVADEDGIVVIPPKEAEAIVDATERLLKRHAGIQDVLLRGEVTNIANIERSLREQGCEFIEE
jgi:4-hydroxy-4-methyl-2-oxoglutarate aldolase